VYIVIVPIACPTFTGETIPWQSIAFRHPGFQTQRIRAVRAGS
jgi:hypothetical protein